MKLTGFIILTLWGIIGFWPTGNRSETLDKIIFVW